MKIVPQRITLDYAGRHTRHLFLHLQPGETIAECRESPAAFKPVQMDSDKKLLRGDKLTIVSDDSLTFAEDLPVLKADGTGVWLGAPARMVSYEPELLFANEQFEIVPRGSRYAVRHRGSGHIEGVLFDTAKAAEYSIHKRAPKTAA